MATKKTDNFIKPGTITDDYGLSLQDFEKELQLGVMPDSFNYKRLFGLFFGGILVVLALIIISAELYRFFDFKQNFEAAVNAEYQDLKTLRSEHHRILTTFEILDDTRGIYRIPVDSAITLIVNESN